MRTIRRRQPPPLRGCFGAFFPAACAGVPVDADRFGADAAEEGGGVETGGVIEMDYIGKGRGFLNTRPDAPAAG